MPISVVCQCGAKLNAKDELAGRSVKCPKCSQSIKIPAAGAEKPAASAAAPADKAAKPQPTTTKPKASKPAATDSIGGLLDEIGVAGPPVKHDITCPKCGAGMTEGALLCIACGFNTKTGKQVASVSDGAALAKREAYFEQQTAKANAQQAKILGTGAVTASGTPVKASKPAAEFGATDWIVCFLCSGIGIIAGIVYCITGNPKGPKMLGISFGVAVVLNIIGFILRSQMAVAP